MTKGKPLQFGTGLHVDTNGYNPYTEEQDEAGLLPTEPVQRWLPLQALVALSDHSGQVEDGGLEVVAGLHTLCQEFFRLQGRFPEGQGEGAPVNGRNFQRWGKYITKFLPGLNDDVIALVQPVRRVPADWEVGKVPGLRAPELRALASKEEIVAHARRLQEELAGFTPGEAIRKGDYVIWDNRLPHQSANQNLTQEIRRVMYLTFLPQAGTCNRAWVDKQKAWREERVPPPDFQQDWKDLEKENELLELSPLGRQIWGYDEYDATDGGRTQRWEQVKKDFPLERRYVEFFKRYGYVVIPNVIGQEQVASLNLQVDEHISKNSPISFEDLQNTLTVKNWLKISCRFGGMLNVFYLKEMDRIRQNPNCYAVQAQLLAETYAPGDLPLFETAPLQPFDPTALNLRIDRMNFRIPDGFFSMAEESV